MEHGMLSRQIEGAQKKVEEQNFVIRKNVLKYDDVLNRHRQRIYEQRRQVLEGEDLSEQVKLWIDEVIEDTVHVFTQDEYEKDWDLEALTNAMAALYQTEITAAELREDLGVISREALIEEFQSDARDEYVAKEEEFGSDLMRDLERYVVL
jgi:preprotein translocase subunit SecA